MIEWGVAGLGNPLLGDDGCGSLLVSMLRDRNYSPWLVDLGTDLLTIQNYRPYPRYLLLVDGVFTGAQGGSLHVWNRAEIDDIVVADVKSVHQLSLLQGLQLLEMTDPGFARVDWRLLGLEAVSIKVGEGVSPAMELGLKRLLTTLTTPNGWRGCFS
ncbi:MAG: hydrogenase maturation protease [Magnetococcales bacterium]|nr:hydrogenase maturation protease [Magnetococcales bacterium]